MAGPAVVDVVEVELIDVALVDVEPVEEELDKDGVVLVELIVVELVDVKDDRSMHSQHCLLNMYPSGHSKQPKGTESSG